MVLHSIYTQIHMLDVRMHTTYSVLLYSTYEMVHVEGTYVHQLPTSSSVESVGTSTPPDTTPNTSLGDGVYIMPRTLYSHAVCITTR